MPTACAATCGRCFGADGFALLAGAGFFTARLTAAVFFAGAFTQRPSSAQVAFFAAGAAAAGFRAAALLGVAAVFLAGLVAIRRGLRVSIRVQAGQHCVMQLLPGRFSQGGGRVRH
ncbi:hypothetical protein C7E12_13385 [Stenotrophomonas maltophilia]|nr:hypothetical protein C7E12_13385 [Stenotrophomonas maltophilia]